MNKVARSTVFVLVSIAFSTSACAQRSSLKVIAEVPVQLGLGYEGQILRHLSVEVSVGLLTQPNSSVIVNILDALGSDEEVTLIIDEAFKFGIVGTLGVNYSFKRNYIGTFLQLIDLHAGDTPADLIGMECRKIT